MSERPKDEKPKKPAGRLSAELRSAEKAKEAKNAILAARSFDPEEAVKTLELLRALFPNIDDMISPVDLLGQLGGTLPGVSSDCTGCTFCNRCNSCENCVTCQSCQTCDSGCESCNTCQKEFQPGPTEDPGQVLTPNAAMRQQFTQVMSILGKRVSF